MKILFAASELDPYVKTGGLGEVMNALPKELHRLGHDVALFVPLHGKIDRNKYPLIPVGRAQKIRHGQITVKYRFWASVLSQEVPVYFFDQPDYFGNHDYIYGGNDGNLRYLLFNKAVFSLLDEIGWTPDVIQSNDWPTGLIPQLIRQLPSRSHYKNVKTVFTIHNPAYIGTTNSWEIPENQRDRYSNPIPVDRAEIKRLNFLERGIYYADIITTVSETHAKELLTTGTDHGLAGLLSLRQKDFYGIRNGIDYNVFNPRTDSNLPVNYDVGLLHRKYDNKRALQHRLGLKVDADVPLLGMNTRISEQKGFDLVFGALPRIMELGTQFVVVGTGHGGYVKHLNDFAKRYPKQFAYHPFTTELGSLVYAGVDLFLMPSRYEPSGLGQMVSLRYGTIPIVRRTGGLASTIFNYSPTNRDGNGFVFDKYDCKEMVQAIKRAFKVFHQKKQWWKLMIRAMSLSYSWEIPAKKYLKLYQAYLKKN